MSLQIQILGDLHDGDVRLRYSPDLEAEIQDVLALNQVVFGPPSIAKEPQQFRAGKRQHQMRLDSGNLERIEKILVDAFDSPTQRWLRIEPVVKLRGFRFFSVDLEPRPANDGLALTRWFNTLDHELPTMMGVYEGAQDLTRDPPTSSFQHWDGLGWGRPVSTAAEAATLSASGHAPAPRHWRGLKANPAA